MDYHFLYGFNFNYLAMRAFTRLWIYPLAIMLALFMGNCTEDELPEQAPVYPSIRLKTSSGLNDGARIYYLALSKNLNFSDLSTDAKFDFRKTNADWYIDGDMIPFVTSYKEFKNPTGEYFLMLNAAGVVVTTKMDVLDGNQTIMISGASYGGITIDCVQP